MKKLSLFVIIFVISPLFAVNVSRANSSAEYYSSKHKIAMDVVLGFNDSIKQFSVNQAVFFIKNDGKDFSGKLSVKLGAGYSNKGPFTIDSKKIFLPELSKKRFYIYFDYQNVSLSAPVVVELISDTGEVLFSEDLIVQKKVSVIRSFPVRFGVSGFLTTVISDNNYGYNFLSGVNTTLTQETRKAASHFTKIQGHSIEYLPYETLPDNSHGYDGANLIVLSDVSPSKLGYDQKRAIARYVQEGGDLLIVKGKNNLWLEDEFVKDLLPCVPAGTIKTLDAIGGYDYEGADKFITELKRIETQRYPVLDVTVREGSTRFMLYDGMPIVISRRYGDGQVFFAAFDPTLQPFAGKKETLDIFSNIFNHLSYKKGVSLGHQKDNSIAGILNNLLDSIMTEDIIKKVTAAFLAAFLLYVIMLGPVNYLVLKRKKRLELAWFTIPITAIIFSIIFLISGYALRGTENYLFSYNIIKVHNSNSFRFSALFSVFASRADDYDVTVERQNIAVNFFDTRKEQRSDNEVEVSDTITVKGVDIKKWSVRNFTINGYLYEESNDFISANKVSDGLIDLEYSLPFRLQRMFLISGDRAFEVNLEKDAKAGRLKLNPKELIYYSEITNLSRDELLYFGMSKKARESSESKGRTERTDLLNYLIQKNMYKKDKQTDYIFALTSDSILDYELKGTKYKKMNNTLIIVAVE